MVGCGAPARLYDNDCAYFFGVRERPRAARLGLDGLAPYNLASSACNDLLDLEPEPLGLGLGLPPDEDDEEDEREDEEERDDDDNAWYASTMTIPFRNDPPAEIKNSCGDDPLQMSSTNAGSAWKPSQPQKKVCNAPSRVFPPSINVKK